MSGKSWLVVFLLVFAGVVLAQQPAPVQDLKYKMSEMQQLRLQLKQKDAIIAQRDASEAQQRYIRTMQEYQALAEDIKKENKWPAEVRFDLNNAVFLDPEPKPAAETKKPVTLPAKP